MTPPERRPLDLTVHRQALLGVAYTVLGRGEPAVEAVGALEVGVALFEGALLLGAHAAEGPVDVHAAVAPRAAVLVHRTVLVLYQTQTLALLALLSDTLVVR